MFVVIKCLGIGKSNKLNVLRCLCLRNSSSSRQNQIQLKTTRLADLLDCSIQTAASIIGQNIRVLSTDDSDIEKTVQFCKNNLRLSDVIEYPMIFSIQHHVLNSRLSTLKEVGCHHGIENIINFNKVMKAKPTLMTHNKTKPYTEELLQKMFTNCSSSEISEISAKLLQMYDKKCSLSQIKKELNFQYLIHQLKFTEEKLHKLKTRIPAIFVENMENIHSTVEILTVKYGFTVTKIRQNPFLLKLHRDHLEKYIETIPTILGVPFQTLVKKNPVILRKSVSSLRKLEAILQNFNVNEQQLLTCPRVLSLKPITARYRLQTLHNSEDFSLFKSVGGFLWLLIHFKHSHTRLKILKQTGLAYSFSMFMVSQPAFKRRIFLNRSGTYLKDIISYLCTLYEVDEILMRKRIAKFPNIYSTSIYNVHRVGSFLLSRGISKEQLWNGLGIIVYEASVVEQFFDKLPHYKEFQPFHEWQGHFNLIQLLIYAIERSSHNLMSSDKTNILNEQESTLGNKEEEEDDSEELFREFGVDYFSDSDVENSDDEDEKISDVNKI